MRKNILGRATAALLGAAAIALAAPALPASATPAASGTFLDSGKKLMPGERLTNGDSALVMQGDGNLVLRLLGSTGNLGPAVWNSGTYGHPGAYAYMQGDGNFVVYRAGGTKPSDALWSSQSWGHPGAYLELLNGWLGTNSSRDGMLWQTATGAFEEQFSGGTWHEGSTLKGTQGLNPGYWLQSNSVWLVNQFDGNLVLYRKRDGAALWSSGTWNRPASVLFMSDTDSHLFMFDLKTGRSSWSTPGTGQSHAYAKVQNDGNFVMYSSNGTPLWNTGTWGNW